MAAPEKRIPNRRRFSSHLVNHQVRLRLVLDDMIFAMIASLVAIAILYFMSNRELGDSLYSAHLSIKETRELLNNGVKVAGLVTFVAVLIFGFWSMIDAHRIAGPMHRLHRLLNEIAEGDLTHEIRFRKKDEFQEIAAAADRVVDVFEVKIGSIKGQVESLESLTSGSELSPDNLAQVRATISDLRRDLEYFKLPANGAAPEIDNSPVNERGSKV